MTGFLTPAHAALCQDKAGRKYRPANHTEGALFVDNFCSVCQHDRTCGILPRTLWYDKEHPEYPAEWQYGADGQPMCTAHQPCGKVSA
jgi:hypothetical protein